jgi:hypothetical protein
VQAITNLSSGEFLLWSVLLSLAALTGLIATFIAFHRARLIEDTPTAKIRSAPQGYVELIGEADLMRGEPVIAPLSNTPCCWWKYRVEKKNNNSWRTQRTGVSDNLFLLRDGTGECIIDPEGASVSTLERQVWYGPTPTPFAGPDRGRGTTHSRFNLFGMAISVNTTFDGDYRYTEETILPGDPLYAIGLFNSLGELDRKAIRDERIRERLRQWKSDHAELLARFDRNRDGHIDTEEWEAARRVAEREVTREQMQEDQQPLHTLSGTGSNRRPLLISTREEFALVRRYRLTSFFSLVGFFALGTGVIWMVTVRFL